MLPPPLAQSFLGVRPLRWYTVPIELDLYHGDYLVIIGQNGSGKSTLVKHFNALLRPTGGEGGSRASTPGTVPTPWPCCAAAWPRRDLDGGPDPLPA